MRLVNGTGSARLVGDESKRGRWHHLKNVTQRIRTEGLRGAARAEAVWVRNWPVLRGKYLALRIHRALYRCGLLRPTWVSIDGIEYWLDSRNYIAQELLLSGVFGAAVLQFVECNLQPTGTFVDVGANHGYVSIPIAKRYPAARVVAIEPDPRAARVLRGNIKRNGIENIQVVETACGRSSGTLPLYLAPEANLGNNSFSSENARSKVYEEVTVRKLDEVVLQALGTHVIDVIKIDTEGAEMSVLAGSEEVLRTGRAKIVMELEERLLSQCGSSKGSIIGHLETRGYRCEGACSDSDFIFVAG